MKDNKNNPENLDDEKVSKVGGVPDAADDKGVDETMGKTPDLKEKRLEADENEVDETEETDTSEIEEDVHVALLDVSNYRPCTARREGWFETSASSYSLCDV